MQSQLGELHSPIYAAICSGTAYRGIGAAEFGHHIYLYIGALYIGHSIYKLYDGVVGLVGLRLHSYCKQPRSQRGRVIILNTVAAHGTIINTVAAHGTVYLGVEEANRAGRIIGMSMPSARLAH